VKRKSTWRTSLLFANSKTSCGFIFPPMMFVYSEVPSLGFWLAGSIGNRAAGAEAKPG
jgi:hypothetical protein